MTASNPAQENVRRLIALTERLTERLTADADAFEARRPHEVAAHVEETARLANLYRHESARVRADPGLVADADAADRQRLMRASEAFEAVLVRHGRALRAAKDVCEGVVRAIAEEVARTRQAGAGYGPGARAQPASGAAIALNRTA